MWVWTLDPMELAPVALVALLYLRRMQTLAARGTAPPRWKPIAFLTGLAVLVVALASPIDWLGENRSFAVHMVQHLLLGDIAPLLCVAGLSGPILRPVLALPLIGSLRWLAHPLIAFPVWAILLATWHLPAAYQAALANDTIHALEHISFFAGGALLWAAILEPLPGPPWFGAGAKALYVLAVRLFETALAFFFVWSQHVFYPYYTHTPKLWGMSPLEDQNLGGVAMLGEGFIVTFCAFIWLLWRWCSDAELQTQLVEEGVPPDHAARAVRYGRGAAQLRPATRSTTLPPTRQTGRP